MHNEEQRAVVQERCVTKGITRNQTYNTVARQGTPQHGMPR